MFQRTLPPAAPPVSMGNLAHGLGGLFSRLRQTRRLEEELRNYFGVRYVYLTSSGKACLVIILKALSSIHPSKKSVIVPAYTCFSVPASLEISGLRMVPCDVNPRNFDFDYRKLEMMIDQDILCILPSHLFGIPSNMEQLRSLVRDKGIFLVEDAAQAMGGRYGGKWIGTIGDAGFFSFGRGKNISCVSGGAILTDSNELGMRINRMYEKIAFPSYLSEVILLFKYFLMSVFIRPFLYWIPSNMRFLKIGETIYDTHFPIARMGGVGSGLLRGWRELLERSNEIRIENSRFYMRKIFGTIDDGHDIAYLRFPLVMKYRYLINKILSVSSEKGFGISAMYPVPVNEIEQIRKRFHDLFPAAKEVSDRLLTLPTHSFMKNSDLEKICELVSSVLKEGENHVMHAEKEKLSHGVSHD